MSKNSKIILLILIFILVVTIIEDLVGTPLWFKNDIWEVIDALATLVTLSLVYFDYNQSKQQLDEITITLQFPDNTKQELFPIKRKNFSRAELKGILREFHDNKTQPYRLRYMKEKEFIDKIFDIQDGNGNEFIMKIYPEDFFEFKQ